MVLLHVVSNVLITVDGGLQAGLLTSKEIEGDVVHVTVLEVDLQEAKDEVGIVIIGKGTGVSDLGRGYFGILCISHNLCEISSFHWNWVTSLTPCLYRGCHGGHHGVSQA